MQEWNERELNDAIQQKDTFCLYLYTPMCGTCQVASKMLTVVLEMYPKLKSGKMNMNYIPAISIQYKIESVPCLLLIKEGQLLEKIYAFQSVPYLYTLLKKLEL
ncbi:MULTISPECIES: thioredoxin family protein [Bacillaceae]|uniref:Thioredoxin-like negative regulator of GroEL n=1 Tax=Peribacillus huizhouensis TaxID=1501239 RepID=A0ABR6CPC2_9BACI|nr:MULTISPECIES: thioredoxin family protein [Bacillaceae]MBA9026883.1 thioredoxin-like negative regulator of GroEL [Peribacillus huizhouensis]